jgi:hypothetical protein
MTRPIPIPPERMRARVLATMAMLGLIAPPASATPTPAAPAKRGRARPSPDLAGQRFGIWLAISRAPSKVFVSQTTGKISTQAMWLCQCSGCGGEAVVNSSTLRAGKSLRCVVRIEQDQNGEKSCTSWNRRATVVSLKRIEFEIIRTGIL